MIKVIAASRLCAVSSPDGGSNVAGDMPGWVRMYSSKSDCKALKEDPFIHGLRVAAGSMCDESCWDLMRRLVTCSNCN
jgi:hypothetical protein